jgi:hypothetical protein
MGISLGLGSPIQRLDPLETGPGQGPMVKDDPNPNNPAGFTDEETALLKFLQDQYSKLPSADKQGKDGSMTENGFDMLSGSCDKKAKDLGLDQKAADKVWDYFLGLID